MFLFLLACAGSKPETGETGETSETGETGETASGATREVLAVSGYMGGTIELFTREGAHIGALEGVLGAQTVTMAPDGTLVACAEELDQIQRFDPLTFTLTEVIIGPETEGGLDGPTAAIYGPDGRLYVADFNGDRVLRYEADGTYVDVFVAAGAGGLDGPDIGMAFGPDGALYVPSWYTDAVYRYDGESGAPIDTVVSDPENLNGPRALAWDEDGGLWITANLSGGVLEVSPEDGVLTRVIDQQRPTGMWLDGDEVLVTNDRGDKVIVFDAATGEERATLIDDPAIDGATALTLLLLPE